MASNMPVAIVTALIVTANFPGAEAHREARWQVPCCPHDPPLCPEHSDPAFVSDPCGDYVSPGFAYRSEVVDRF